MEMRIIVPDAASTGSLAERLTFAFGPERVSVMGDRREVDVRVEGESDNTVVRVLETVERWVEQTGAGSAQMWLGEHSYRIAAWAPPNTFA